MMSEGRERALDDLADAAASALAILQRVGGSDRSVLAQIANHDQDGALSAKVASDLASLLRAMAEGVRCIRVVAGESVGEPGVLRDSQQSWRCSIARCRSTVRSASIRAPSSRCSSPPTGSYTSHLNRFLRLC